MDASSPGWSSFRTGRPSMCVAFLIAGSRPRSYGVTLTFFERWLRPSALIA